jgi:hypothetical protein
VYCLEEAQAALRLKKSTVRREVRSRRLRISKRAGRYYILGKWLLEWLENGELPQNGLNVPSCNGESVNGA